MKTNSKKLVLSAIVAGLTLMVAVLSPMQAGTIATFSDPASDASTPLMQVDLLNDIITGGWADSQMGLDLEVVYTGNIFEDAFFTMTALTYTGDINGGVTGGGAIKFYKDGDSSDVSAVPLVQFDFDSAYISPVTLGSHELFFENVTITGSEIFTVLAEEAFSFSFANQTMTPDGGFVATAAMTSSAVPEPATLTLLSMGLLVLRRGRKR